MIPTTRRRAAGVALVGLLLALVACGSGGAPDAGPGPGPAPDPTSTDPSTAVSSVAAPGGYPVGIAFGNRLLGADDKQLDQELDDTVRLGARWIRIDLSWADLQPVSPRAWKNREGLDRVVAGAAQRGLQVLGILTYTPAWARAPGCELFTCPPADPTAFASFAGRLAARYAGRVAGYEIWNEPNIPPFWSTPDPVAYGTLLHDTMAAVRAADPAAKVITGGLAPNGRADGAIEAGTFLREACGSGACDGVDGIGFHPYTYPHSPEQGTDPPSAWQRMTVSSPGVPSIDSVLADVGLGDVPLWLTEFGAPTGGPGRAADGSLEGFAQTSDHVTEGWQAHIIGEAVGLAEADPSRYASIFVYTLDDLPPSGAVTGTKEDHFGLRRADGSEKPAFEAFRSAATGQ